MKKKLMIWIMLLMILTSGFSEPDETTTRETVLTPEELVKEYLIVIEAYEQLRIEYEVLKESKRELGELLEQATVTIEENSHFISNQKIYHPIVGIYTGGGFLANVGEKPIFKPAFELGVSYYPLKFLYIFTSLNVAPGQPTQLGAKVGLGFVIGVRR